jgi:thioredoxin reductase
LPNRVHVATLEGMWDCIIVGGGAAGLNAALMLGRARRKTLLIDAGNQSNLPAAGVHGLIGHDGKPPRQLYAEARRELEQYTSVEFRAGTVTDAEPGFTIEGERARTVLLATGMDYRFKDVPGLKEHWGDSVFHCPFCHGWEHRDEPLGVLDDGERAQLLRFWSDDVTVYDADAIAEVRHGSIAFKDGTERVCKGLLVPVTLHQRSDLAQRLGARLAEPGMMAADAIAIDAMYRTSVPGLFAAGDAASERPSITNAIIAGAMAAAAIVHHLL